VWLIAHRWTPRVLAFFVLAALPLLAAAPASGERRSRFEAASGPSDARNARLGALSDPGAPGGAFLGIQVRDAPGSAGGALVAAVVPGAPGDQAGVREGDIIVSLFGTPVTGAAQFARAASALQVGLPYPLEVIRGEARLTLTVRPVQEGGADFSRQSGDSWIARQTDPAVITDVTRQLAASAAFAETAMKEAIAGNLEAARDLAERSAKAMTGELDLTGLPPVEAAIEPRSVAAFGAANASLVEETHRALDELMQAQSEMARAQAVASSSPEEAARIRRDAEAVQDKALEKFRQLVAAAGVLRSDPRQASAVAITLSSLNAVVAPPAAPGTSAGPVATPQSAAASAGRPAPATPEEWKDRVSAWRKELEETERQIEATRGALLRLNRSILQNAQLFEEWERSSDEAFARCVETAGSLAIDFGIEGLSGRYETIYGLARKLPAPPQALLEKYRHLVEMVQRLKESKAVLDASSLVERENESPGEVLETIRDGIGQITGLLNLDKTVPGAAWKYGSLFFDNLYNLAELYHTWKNVTALERSNDQLAEGVRRLSERLKDLHSRSRELRRKIEEAGEDAGSGG